MWGRNTTLMCFGLAQFALGNRCFWMLENQRRQLVPEPSSESTIMPSAGTNRCGFGRSGPTARLCTLRGQAASRRLQAQATWRPPVGQALQLQLLGGGVSVSAYAAVGAFHGAEGLCGIHCGLDLGDDARAQTRTDAPPSGAVDHRCTHAEALARVVVGTVCTEYVLEDGASPVHAAIG